MPAVHVEFAIAPVAGYCLETRCKTQRVEGLKEEKTMAEHVQVITTAGGREAAAAIGRAMVEKRLAACAQLIGPVTSTYRWKGKVETAEEWMCLMKTRSDLYRALERAICEAHPYEVPEVIAVPVEAGSAAYLKWLDEQVG